MTTSNDHYSTILNIVVSPEFKARVQAHARFHGMNTSEYVRGILRQAMAEEHISVPVGTI